MDLDHKYLRFIQPTETYKSFSADNLGTQCLISI